MSLTLIPPADNLPLAARADLAAAIAALEHVSLAARLAALAGAPIEALKRRLPAGTQGMVDDAVRRALDAAMQAALRTSPGRTPPRLSTDWLHRGLAAATGAAGGAFGLPGTLAELPVSTTLLLRRIAAVAQAEGEDLARPETAAECLKVFALSGNSAQDDAAETGYFAARLALAQTLPAAVSTAGGTLLPGFLAAIAARFAGPVTLKLAAQAAPFVGAAAGVAVNLAFLEHFRRVAQGHFTVRRLERAYGPTAIRQAWRELAPDKV